MQKRYKILILALLAAVIAEGIFCMHCMQNHRHADIDTWSGSLVTAKIEYAQAARDYGAEKSSYNIPRWEYDELLDVLKTVTEENSSRTENAKRLEPNYRLGFQYDERLWLFQCCEDGIVSLTFEHVETGAYYGCEGSSLYIDSPELWNYIINTVDSKATKHPSE